MLGKVLSEAKDQSLGAERLMDSNININIREKYQKVNRIKLERISVRIYQFPKTKKYYNN